MNPLRCINIAPAAVENVRGQTLARARRAFHEYHAECFWSSDPALEITATDIPFVIVGLRKHSGHKA